MKKLCKLALIVLMMVPNLPIRTLALTTKNENSQTASVTYYKDQLNDTEKMFYDAMEEMLTSGAFKSGKGSRTLDIAQLDVRDYVSGNPMLAKAFQVARDAFTQDKPEVFYVDFSKVTFRVGKVNGTYVAYLNTGSNENYYAQGYANEDEVESAMMNAEETKKTIIDELQKNELLSKDQLVRQVHHKLVERLDYAPSQSAAIVDGIDTLGTDEKKANCEGYARSMKWILDDLGVPNVLVSGNGINSRGSKEYHMWNYVQIEDEWYGVDATWDDPILQEESKSAETNSSKYLLKGSDTLNENHFPMGQLSNGSKTFYYPELNAMDYDAYIDTVFEDTGTDLKILAEKGEGGDITFTSYQLSYKGMTLEEIEKSGYVLAARFANKDKMGPWTDFGAYAIDPKAEVIKFPMSVEGSIQFCITKEVMGKGERSYSIDLSEKDHHETITKILKIPYWSDYVPAPFVRTSEPQLGKTIAPQKQHYRVEYDELLVKKNEKDEIGIDVTNTQEHLKYNVSNIELSESSFTLLDGNIRKTSVLEFDFDPDKSYQGYMSTYSLQPSNLVAAESGIIPNSFTVRTSYGMSVPCNGYTNQGKVPNAFVIANPTLVVSDSMDIFDYKNPADGKPKPNALDIRLVASIPSDEQKDAMLGSIPNSEAVKSSATFDLSLNCQDQAMRLKSEQDYNVTIGIPYPDGFNYNDHKDVVFKAYHYVLQEDGTYKAEELACRITPQGLEVIAESFSPFSVVAMDKKDVPAEDATYKLVNIATDTLGGKVTMEGKEENVIGAAGLYKLSEETPMKTFTVQADEGYVIDKVLVDGVEVEHASGKTTVEHVFKYESSKVLSETNADESANTLQVFFIAKTVKEAEEKAGFEAQTPVFVEITPALESIEITSSPTITKYEEDSMFNKTGMLVNAKYSDQTQKLITNYTIDVEGPLKKGTTKVVVSYREGGIEKRAEQAIQVGDEPEVSVVPVESITLNKEELMLMVGGSELLSVSVLPESASNKAVEYASSNEKVASVDAKGNVKALKAGTAIISAKATDGSGVKDTITITVKDIKITNIKITDDQSIEEGKTLQLETSILPEDATNKNLEYVSSDEDIATIDESGNITALRPGVVTISAKATDGSDIVDSSQITITKNLNPIHVESISLKETVKELKEGEKTTLVAVVLPANASNKAVQWESSDHEVAIVDANGNITALKAGKATITATSVDGKLEAKCEVSVIKKDESVDVTGINLDKTNEKMVIKNTLKLNGEVLPTNATNKKIVWTSSNRDIAIVDAEGNVTAISSGTAIITAKSEDGGFMKTCTIDVSVPVKISAITISPETGGSSGKTVIKKGSKLQLNVTIAPVNATDKTILWSSSDERIASVDDNGLVSAVGTGTVSIHARANDGAMSRSTPVTTRFILNVVSENVTPDVQPEEKPTPETEIADSVNTGSRDTVFVNLGITAMLLSLGIISILLYKRKINS